jgi:hypothetical protein
MHALGLDSRNSVLNGVRRRALLAVLVGALLACAYGLAGPVQNANATINQFCWGAAVGPWGQCTASFTRPLVQVSGKGGQASACVNAYEGGSLVSSWVCQVTNTWANISYSGTRQLAGTVRNNVGNNNVLYGEMWW